MVNFMYPAGDGRLKTLNFVINDADDLDAEGEELVPSGGYDLDVQHFVDFLQSGVDAYKNR